MPDDPYADPAGETADDAQRPVGAVVVDDQHLPVGRFSALLRNERGKRLGEPFTTIVGTDRDCEERAPTSHGSPASQAATRPA